MKLRTGNWKLSDLQQVEKNGLTVFSCFHCGGGSSFGYKLAGFEVLGGVEIDPQMMKIYRANHKPKHSYLMGVQEFRHIKKEDLPPELLNLDILDGSPPCSSFSMAGSREDAWGDKKKFREGQAEQVLDNLFFDFIAIGKTLQPKVIIAENVKGLIVGKARGYVKQIFAAFSDAGYDTQLFLLNASKMGVPQRRERTFFIARRKDQNFGSIRLEFNEPLITVNTSWSDLGKQEGRPLTEFTMKLWEKSRPGDSMAKVNNGNGFNNTKIAKNAPCHTIAFSGGLYHHSEPRGLSETEIARLQTFPDDFQSGDVGMRYVCGMSVPPFMMQRLSDQIAKQWFNK